MATKGKAQEQHVVATEAAMTGILALLVDEREARTKGDKGAEKIEVLLSQAGLSNDDIAAVTGKHADAVRMAIARAKSKKRSA